MTKDIKQWQEKMKEYVSSVEFRTMIKQNASWKPLIFYRLDGEISRYHDKSRFKNIVKTSIMHKLRDELPSLYYDSNISLFNNIEKLQKTVPW